MHSLHVLHLNLQLQENQAEAAEQRQADEARHAREVAAITRQFEQQAEDLRAEINASRIDEEGGSMGGAEVDLVVEHPISRCAENNENAEGEITEEDGGNDSDDDEDDVGNFDLPDDASRRSLV